MSSQAYADWLSALNRVEKLLALERKYADPPRRSSVREAVEGLRAGAVILLVACFQQFLKDLLEERLASLQNSDVVFDNLPEKVRVTSIYIALQTAMDTRLHPGRSRTELLPEIVGVCENIVNKRLNVSAFSVIGNNPSPEAVKELFSRAGLQDIFSVVKPDFEVSWQQQVNHSFIHDKLDEIVNRRHIAAHTSRTLDLSRADLGSYVRFMRCLAHALDDCCERHIISVRTSNSHPNL